MTIFEKSVFLPYFALGHLALSRNRRQNLFVGIQSAGRIEMSKRHAAQKRFFADNDRFYRDMTSHSENQRTASARIANNEIHHWSKRIHSVERAYERHGVVIDLFGLREIEERIKSGRTVQPGLLLLGHAGRDYLYRRTSIWLATISGRIVPLVYDHDADAVTTVLPMDAHQLRFEDGIFVRLASGGTKAGRDYWAAITQ